MLDPDPWQEHTTEAENSTKPKIVPVRWKVQNLLECIWNIKLIDLSMMRVLYCKFPVKYLNFKADSELLFFLGCCSNFLLLLYVLVRGLGPTISSFWLILWLHQIVSLLLFLKWAHWCLHHHYLSFYGRKHNAVRNATDSKIDQI